MSKPEKTTPEPIHPAKPRPKPRGLAALSSTLQTMAKLELIMNDVEPADVPEVAAWYHGRFCQVRLDSNPVVRGNVEPTQ